MRLLVVLSFILTGWVSIRSEEMIVVFSAYSSSMGLDRIEDEFERRGAKISFNNRVWLREDIELQSVDVEIVVQQGKMTQSRFRFHELNKATLVIFKLSKNGIELQMGADINIAQESLWPLFTQSDLALSSSDAEVLTSTGLNYLFENQDRTDQLFNELRNYFYDTLALVKKVNGDRNNVSQNQNFEYYYNEQRIESSFGISTVLFDTEVAFDLNSKPIKLYYYSSQPYSY